MRSGVPAWIGLIIWLLLAVPARCAELRPFTSDGCSAFPDGTPFQQQLWLSCCNTHDLAYWRGGTEAERLAADLALRNCVAAVGEPEVAAVILAGVRVGGAPWLPTPFHWGYGWTDNRGYQPLTAGELAIVEKMLKRGGQ